MSKWNIKEFEIIEWVLKNISELSLDEKYRKNLSDVRKGPVLQLSSYTPQERSAIAASLDYFCELYTSSIKGYPNGNRTIRQIKARLELLKSAMQKAMETSDIDKQN